MEAADGFVQVVADKESKQILGVQIVGPEASSLISEAVLAIEMGTTAKISVSRFIHTPLCPKLSWKRQKEYSDKRFIW